MVASSDTHEAKSERKFRKELTTKLDVEKAKLRDLRPLKVRIECARDFTARRRNRRTLVQNELAKLKQEEEIVTTP